VKLSDNLIDFHIGENAEYTLTFRLYDHRVAHRIWHRQLEFGHMHQYVSRTRFYNWGETPEQVSELLDQSVNKILELKPDIVFSDSDNLNELHVNFPDLIKTETNPELRHWLSMFNYHLHHLEDITRYKNRRIITCANAHNDPEPLEPDDFDLFTTSRKFGGLYMNYPHVGKHVSELFFDNDVDIPQDHIVPTSVFKNDFYIWFTSDTKHNDTLLKKQIRRWCMGIADKLPFPPDDKRLAIGYIPLGMIDSEIDLEQIAKHKYIHSILARKDDQN